MKTEEQIREIACEYAHNELSNVESIEESLRDAFIQGSKYIMDSIKTIYIGHILTLREREINKIKGISDVPTKKSHSFIEQDGVLVDVPYEEHMDRCALSILETIKYSMSKGDIAKLEIKEEENGDLVMKRRLYVLTD